MKFPYLPAAVLLATALFLGACSSPPRLDPDTGLPTGIPTVTGKRGNEADSQALVATVQSMAVQFPGRTAYETAVMQKIRTGELDASALAVTYEDGTSKVFK